MVPWYLGEVEGVEGLGDDHIGVLQLLLQLAPGTVLVAGDHKGVAVALQELRETEHIGDRRGVR